jgi:hypothetical protein
MYICGHLEVICISTVGFCVQQHLPLSIKEFLAGSFMVGLGS